MQADQRSGFDFEEDEILCSPPANRLGEGRVEPQLGNPKASTDNRVAKYVNMAPLLVLPTTSQTRDWRAEPMGEAGGEEWAATVEEAVAAEREEGGRWWW